MLKAMPERNLCSQGNGDITLPIPQWSKDVKRILCSDKLPERVRLVCFALGARPVCPAKDKKF